ncbi:bifunctional phosphopantothenoylcysteine decarboxylase/phosphopantothenate--cysteine ligase CoaBC [Clostridium tepidum]|jgi:phosphopantothenoylcysteine decarboxylase/phosphopantothenate--cysteine ligase|uniref:Coenzyme A biosynthesis bifunctional protein CoaBC n=1 Tax=Clostridium tepidum TaxID=1962263 RepID=A0A1S9I834_9CLOT|nr:bifunctional phosphopantothenoylcysteine decarboxylase/phosphopantothenate--cysteine ligase CoaBC [Clostridium tepidum]MCR1935476.1 bifunctional phosphopantothenoylcysteine decarboxylase/phosphopantothenate--cysteine ligase CoaBC [Clostridium tepidum]MDU6876952.1 bifunctional phosphopantothenoylcysteine decarboxylase/phosphopantothenate--cysteine ligase CoaBC [Clostridium botulinum]OOO63471.1 bifunctional 4'-phosphopantothenoylcysteine decarboxylase/phosphopantothenoylcysteine synthetase [Clo
MNKKCIVLGVTGGIASYKALDIVSRLKKLNYDINVIMTKSALKFIQPLPFQSLSGNMVSKDMFEEPKAFEIQHISLSKKADMILVAPATANIIGKVANGIADDMLSTTIMAANCPVVFAPAMNTNMYNNPIVQNNIKKLKNLGYKFIEPASGRLACGDVGEGKLADTEDIVEIVDSMLYSIKDLQGKNVLVTAGPTVAYIDPVRYITNRSSGKMGYSIAKEARDRGAKVTLVSGPTKLKAPLGVDLIKINTNEEMLKAVKENFKNQHIVIKSAAVADYKPKEYKEHKIKKIGDDLNLELIKDKDILKELGLIKEDQILVGFAAESRDLLDNAKSKLEKKNLDFIVANNILSKETGFASDDNVVTIISKEGYIKNLEKMSKREIAKEIFGTILNKK